MTPKTEDGCFQAEGQELNAAEGVAVTTLPSAPPFRDGDGSQPEQRGLLRAQDSLPSSVASTVRLCQTRASRSRSTAVRIVPSSGSMEKQRSGSEWGRMEYLGKTGLIRSGHLLLLAFLPFQSSCRASRPLIEGPGRAFPAAQSHQPRWSPYDSGLCLLACRREKNTTFRLQTCWLCPGDPGTWVSPLPCLRPPI